MKNQLSDHYTFKKLISATFASINMMIFTSLYSVVDGLCISNFTNDGGDAFAGVNLIFPVIMVVGGLGFMFGSGGSALAGKRLGEGNREKANQVFTNIILAGTVVGIILSIIGFFLIEPISKALGTISSNPTDGMVNEAIKYGRIIMLAQAAFMLENMFQNFLIVNEKPGLGFLFMVAGGLTNIIFDLLFIGVFKWGSIGAAIATGMGYTVGAVLPIIYFFTHKNGNISFSKCKLDLYSIGKSCLNGVSEFINNIALQIVAIVFNIQLLRFYGQVGVEAYGIIMYVILIFIAIFIGYGMGAAPIISYHFGAKNEYELKSLLKKSLIIISMASLAMLALGELSTELIVSLFSHGNTELQELTTVAMRIYSISFLFCGFSMFLSSFFTALNDGLVSGLICLIRTFVCSMVFLIILPIFWEGKGVWWSVAFAEGTALIISFLFLIFNKKKYNY